MPLNTTQINYEDAIAEQSNCVNEAQATLLERRSGLERNLREPLVNNFLNNIATITFEFSDGYKITQTAQSAGAGTAQTGHSERIALATAINEAIDRDRLEFKNLPKIELASLARPEIFNHYRDVLNNLQFVRCYTERQPCTYGVLSCEKFFSRILNNRHMFYYSIPMNTTEYMTQRLKNEYEAAYSQYEANVAPNSQDFDALDEMPDFTPIYNNPPATRINQDNTSETSNTESTPTLFFEDTRTRGDARNTLNLTTQVQIQTNTEEFRRPPAQALHTAEPSDIQLPDNIAPNVPSDSNIPLTNTLAATQRSLSNLQQTMSSTQDSIKKSPLRFSNTHSSSAGTPVYDNPIRPEHYDSDNDSNDNKEPRYIFTPRKK